MIAPELPRDSEPPRVSMTMTDTGTAPTNDATEPVATRSAIVNAETIATEPVATPSKNLGGRPRRHGLRIMRDTLRTLTTRRLDGRTAVAQATRRFKADLVRDLGGDPSRAQHAIIETAARTWVLLSSVDDWLQRQQTIVNAKRRTLIPVVRERLQLADSLLRHLQALGLERRAKPVQDIRRRLGLD